jgi:hypothetical protein
MSGTEEEDFCQALAEFRAKHRRGAWMYVGVRLNDPARKKRCQQWVKRQPAKARVELILWAEELGVLTSLREYYPFNPTATPLSELGLRNMIVMIAEALATLGKDWRLHKTCPKKRDQPTGRMVLVIERRLDA